MLTFVCPYVVVVSENKKNWFLSPNEAIFNSTGGTKLSFCSISTLCLVHDHLGDI